MHINGQIVPEAIQPVLFNVFISTANVEFAVKMISLVLSSAYLLYRWRLDIIKNRKNKSHE
jgi:hypothetical protein